MAHKRGWVQGHYRPTNPEKYVGNKLPIYRSSWELSFCHFCDNHPSVLQWASEAIRIPYRNPISGKQTIYVPDFFVLYEGKDGKRSAEMIEIKPSSQAMIMEGKKTPANMRATIAINHAKWAQAKAFCDKRGIKFRVITEGDMFSNRR